jgi:PEP-CTERM motif
MEENMFLANLRNELRCLFAVTITLFIPALITPASAGTLTPNPANGMSPATSMTDDFNWTVSLTPNPALYMTSCPWLLPAAQAAAQLYNKDPNQQWNFSYATTFNGKFALQSYQANAAGVLGFPEFTINYTPGDGDPSGNDVRWVQVIDTNMPSARGTAYGVPGTGANGIPMGTTAYLDNEGAKGTGDKPATGWPSTDPWYGWLSVPAGKSITDSTMANSTMFSDTPIMKLVNGFDWEAQVFLAKDTVTVDGTKTVHDTKLYGGVWWGFVDTAVAVPEPATGALIMFGLGLLVPQLRAQLISRRRHAPLRKRPAGSDCEAD